LGATSNKPIHELAANAPVYLWLELVEQVRSGFSRHLIAKLFHIP
jgi:hypothetical protein